MEFSLEYILNVEKREERTCKAQYLDENTRDTLAMIRGSWTVDVASLTLIVSKSYENLDSCEDLNDHFVSGILCGAELH